VRYWWKPLIVTVLLSYLSWVGITAISTQSRQSAIEASSQATEKWMERIDRRLERIESLLLSH